MTTGKITFEYLAQMRADSAQCAAVAIFRRLASKRATRITLTAAELVDAEQFQLVGETELDGRVVFTLERKRAVI